MKGVVALAASAAFIAMAGYETNHELCQGFLPENDLNISIYQQSNVGGGITEEEFHEALDRLEAHYAPIVENLGGKLDVSRQWENGTVNASAQRFGSTYRINMYGGLARHPEVNIDGFLLVACHEMGHHLAGAPKRGWLIGWASNEGQSDYFAGLRCLRELWTAEENESFIKNNEIDSFLAESCAEAWANVDEQNLCIRIAMAGMNTTSLFRALRSEDPIPHYSTPDPERVSKTYHSHPATQCRLDTYFQSGLCIHDMSEELSNDDVRVGTCTESGGWSLGVRPRCWYGERY